MVQKLKEDLLLLVGSFIVAVLGLVSVFCPVGSLAWPTVFATDLYLFCVLLFAAIRSDAVARAKGFWPCLQWVFPSRTAGVFVAALLFIALISGFAGLYLGLGEQLSPPVQNPIDALYFSFFTLGFGNFTPVTECAKLIVMSQLVSGILFLVGVFPLLISRLSNF